MKTNNFFVFVALICLTTYLKPEKVFTQDLNDTTANYFTLTDYYDQYYDSLIQLRGAENMQGTGYKDYLRWKWFYITRHGVDGELHEIWQSISDSYDNFQVPQGYVDNSDWQFMGPSGVPLSHGELSSENTGKGMMISLWVDDGDHSLMYAGSHHSGLWKTTDGGENWFPLHDDDARIHGVNSIAVDPTDHNILYITCNSSLSSDPVGKFSEYTTGLFKSSDGGDTWNQLNPGVNYPAPNKSASARKIIVDPNDPDNLFFISYRLVSRSFDKGGTWDTVFFKNYDPWNAAGSFQFHNGLWDFEICPWDSNVAYLAGSEIFLIDNPLGVFDTINISDSVFLIGLDTNDFMVNHPHRCEISMHNNFPGSVWFCYACNYERNGVKQDWDRVVRYDEIHGYQLIYDSTETYYGPGLSESKLEFNVSPSDSNAFYLGGVGIYKIEATQSSFTLNNIADDASEFPDSCWIHVDMRDMLLFSDGQGNDTLYLANDAGISWGTPFKGDHGACSDNSWYWRHPFESDENGLNVTEYYGISAFNSEIDLVAGGCQDLSNMILMDKKWFNFGEGDGSEIAWDSEDSSRFYFSEWQNGYLYRTNDFGASESKFFNLANGNPFMPMEIDPDAANILYSGDKKLYKFIGINNSGPLNDTVLLKEFPYIISDIEVSHPSGMPKRYYVSTYHTKNSATDSNCIYKSTNGTYFTDISAGLEGCLHGFIADVEVNPEDNSQIWVAISVYNNNPAQKKKVYKSSDYGANWQEYAQGLPPGMPVFELRYIPEYQFLLAATDVGIYKRNLQDTCWFPFYNNLPAGKIITDLEVNVKNNKIYASTYGRGLWKSPLRCEYNETPWTIREDLIWERDTILDRSIVVADTVSLTIRNCKIFMPADAKILVQRGATLILDHCTLTSACNDLWWGVEVWGNSHYSQATSVQGKIEMKNNALIEKARKAIFCGKNIENTYPDWAFTGGIVDARESVFKNNRYGVMLWSYHYPEIMCIFRGCKFETNQILADGSSPEYFMTLVQVDSVKIEGCDFKNSFSMDPDFTEHGRGIYAIDAGFRLLPNTINSEKDTLENLECGIFALKLYENQPIEIHDTYFVKNLTGVYASGIETLDLYSNKFLVDTDSLPPGTQVFGGVYLDHCTGYTVEENYFHGNQAIGNGTTSIGLTVNNSGSANNEIYKNTFYSLHIGTLAQNINRNSKYPNEGLKLNCNVYNLNEYDIAVTGSQGCGDCGISILQGSPNVPAGNLFSQLGDYPTSDFDNQMRKISYYHHRFIGSDTTDNHWIPRYYSDSVLLNNTYVYWTDTTCSSKLESLRNKELNNILFEKSTSESDSIQNILSQLIDGGNTMALEMDILFAQADDALELKDELLEYSPYLSDTILIKSVEKEDVLNSVMIKEIMVANPQSAKSDQVIQALDNREDTIPGYMMAEIMEGKDSVGQKEMLESDLSYWDLQKEIAMNQLIHYYTKDSAGSVLDSIINLLEDANSLQSKYRLIMVYFEKDDTISALNTIENIPDQFSLDAYQSTTHQHWTDFLNIIMTMQRESIPITSLDSSKLAALTELSFSEDLPGGMAGNILHYIGIAETGPYYLLPVDQFKSDQSKPTEAINLFSNEGSFLKIYPNPAKNYLIVEYNLEQNFGNGILNIYCSDGQLQFCKTLDGQKHDFVINTRNWHNGIYFYNFIIQDDSEQNGKIIISK